MSNQETPDTNIGNIKSDDELAQEELKILEEASRLADDIEDSEENIQKEVERIQEEHPNLVFEPNPNLIGSGVQVSPELLEWAVTHGIMSKMPHKKAHPRKHNIDRVERTKKRKAQKNARKKNRRK